MGRLWKRLQLAFKSTHYTVLEQCFNCMHISRFHIPLGVEAEGFIAKSACPICKVSGKWCE